MGSMFRSDKMAMCHIFMQCEVAYETVAELGELGLVQFKDSNEDKSVQQRTFASNVRLCEEIEREREITFIKKEITAFEIEVSDIENHAEIPSPSTKEIQKTKETIEKAAMELRELRLNQKELMISYEELLEHKLVLDDCSTILLLDKETINFDLNSALSTSEERRGPLGYIAGCLPPEKAFAFERMVWRVSRGNTFIRTRNVVSDDNSQKCVFVILYQGEALDEKVRKICSGFHASLYQCSSVEDERKEMLMKVLTRIEDLEAILNETEEYQRLILNSVLEDIPKYEVQVKKMKAIFHTMNCFKSDVTSKCLVAECWIPQQDISMVSEAVRKLSGGAYCSVQSFLDVVQTKEVPPTFVRTNKFTKAFQNLIDAYGLNSYREINPGLYTIITFPFLFGVMYGDIGHGLILLIFALWMVLWEKSLIEKGWKDEIWSIFFGGRYIILLMAGFAIYAGVIHNDIFSFSLNIFGSKWTNMYNETTLSDENIHFLQLDPASDVHGSYTMGIDPIWQVAANKIIFLNNFKMKMSVIFGIVHMSFGIFLNAANMINFKKYSNLILEFIPQFLFLMLIFGYMCFLMIYKWIVFTAQPENDNDTYLKPGCAPSVLLEFINMMMFKTPKEKDLQEGCHLWMYSGQQVAQISLLVVGLLCVPWLLCGKPLYIRYLRNKRDQMAAQLDIEFPETADKSHSNSDQEIIVARQELFEIEHDDMTMEDVWIYQAIHTVEYVLSTISHTASYLRLWALSLAHAQLSEVLYSKILRLSFSLVSSYFMVPVVIAFFAAWAVLTVFILVIIEGLSAFLHTLRLHWVEFNNKFFKGEGYAFTPFDFNVIFDKEELN